MGVTIIAYNGGAHESISPGDTATGIATAKIQPTSGKFNGLTAKSALITVEDNSIRLCYDGTTPTNSNGTSADTGHLVTAGQSYLVEGDNSVKNFKCIDAVSGSTAVIKATTNF